MVTNPAVHELNNIEVQGGDSDFAVVNIAGSTDDVLLEYDDSAGQWSFAGVVSGSDLADGSVTVEELAAALGTDSNNPVSGTTYFENLDSGSVSTGTVDYDGLTPDYRLANSGMFEQESIQTITSTTRTEVLNGTQPFIPDEKPSGQTLVGRFICRISNDTAGETTTVIPRVYDSGQRKFIYLNSLERGATGTDSTLIDTGWVDISADIEQASNPHTTLLIEGEVTGGTGTVNHEQTALNIAGST